MTEYRFVTFRQPASALFPANQVAVKSLTIDFLGSIPELASHMDGWEVVNFQLTHTDTAEVLITMLLKTTVDTSELD